MKTKYLLLLFSFLLVACSDSEDPAEQPFEPKKVNVNGKVEKGPFVSGSTITMQLLDNQLQTVGSLYSSTILDNVGNFNFGAKTISSPYAELMANGYFYNEVSGELSQGMVSLRALVDVSDYKSVNVNLLTHLKSQRVQRLVEQGQSFAQANQQAQRELLSRFGLQRYADADVSQYSITEGSDYSGALIAISSLLLEGRSEAELTEFLAKLSLDFAEDGDFSDEVKAILKKNRDNLSPQLPRISENIISRYQDLNMEVKVPNLARYFDWNDDGVAGNEILADSEKVTLETDTLEVPFERGVYKVKVNSPIALSLSPVWQDAQGTPTPEDFYKEVSMKMTTRMENNTIVIELEPKENGAPKCVEVPLYDGVDNIVATLVVKQLGDHNDGFPQFGLLGEGLFMSALYAQAYACRSYSDAFQLYAQYKDIPNGHFDGMLRSYNNGAWEQSYLAINNMLQMKEKDHSLRNCYQDFCNVHLAIYYTYMVNTWGDVPYFKSLPGINDQPARTPKAEIFADLKPMLQQALDGCEEKRNRVVPAEGDKKGLSAVFFVSKDVARIALANILLHEGHAAEAAPLLEKVISNGFYQLEGLDYTDAKNFVLNTAAKSYGSPWETMKNSKEVIWGAIDERNGNGATFIPAMNYAEVLLCYAECLYKMGDVAQARTYLDQVLADKKVSVADDDVLKAIAKARLQIFKYDVNTFAFLQRNHLGEEMYGVESYRMLFPIPENEMHFNQNMTQNPEY